MIVDKTGKTYLMNTKSSRHFSWFWCRWHDGNYRGKKEVQVWRTKFWSILRFISKSRQERKERGGGDWVFFSFMWFWQFVGVYVGVCGWVFFGIESTPPEQLLQNCTVPQVASSQYLTWNWTSVWIPRIKLYTANWSLSLASLSIAQANPPHSLFHNCKCQTKKYIYS